MLNSEGAARIQAVIDIIIELDSLRGYRYADLTAVQRNANAANVEWLLEQKIPSWKAIVPLLKQKLSKYHIHVQAIGHCMHALPWVMLATLIAIGLLWLHGEPWDTPPCSIIALAATLYLALLYLYRFVVEERCIRRILRDVGRDHPQWRDELASAVQAMINMANDERMTAKPGTSSLKVRLSHCDYQGLEIIHRPGMFAHYNFLACFNPLVQPIANSRKEANIILKRPERYVLNALKAACTEIRLRILTTKAVAKRLRLDCFLGEMRKNGYEVRVRTCSIRQLDETAVITEQGAWVKAADSRSSRRPVDFVLVQDPEAQESLAQSFRNVWRGAEHYPLAQAIKTSTKFQNKPNASD